MNSYLEKSIQLLGEEKISSFSTKKIAIIGIGGVGGTALEGLARSGCKNFILIDCDKVDGSNLNRQILYTKKDIGKEKVVVAKERLLSIAEDLEVEIIKAKIDSGSLKDLFKNKPDFIIDAIDFIPGKLEIYKYCLENNIPFVSSLGMGNRLDPEQITITTLNKTENDPLAKKIRYLAKQEGFDLKLIPVIFSKEVPLFKSAKPASMIMVPSTAGLLIVKYVLNTIL